MSVALFTTPALPLASGDARRWEDEIVYVVIIEKFFNGDPANDIMRGRFLEERERFVRRTTAWLMRLRAAGAIDAGIDPEVAAETLGALTEQLAYVKLGLAREKPSDAEIERLGSHSARIWYRGVFGRER